MTNHITASLYLLQLSILYNAKKVKLNTVTVLLSNDTVLNSI